MSFGNIQQDIIFKPIFVITHSSNADYDSLTLAAKMEQMATDILFMEASSKEHRHSITSRAQRYRSNDCKRRATCKYLI